MSGFRLIGGTFRNRPLKSPKGSHTRPTSALLRKAVFDICKSFIDGADVLDLFAGTGAMGLEALSRGAAHATFVDNDKKALTCIYQNSQLLKVESQCSILAGDVELILQRLKKLKKSFDLIYIDPPYGQVNLSALLNVLDKSDLIKPDGLLFIEDAFPSKEALGETPLKNLRLIDIRKYGKSLLYQFQR